MTEENQLSRELLNAFAEESADLLVRLGRELIALEHVSLEEQSQPLIRLQRDLHTLKGASSAVGLSQAANICHQLEEAIKKINDQELVFPRPMLDAFHSALNYLEAVAKGESKNDGQSVMEQIKATMSQEQSETKVAQSVRQKKTELPEQKKQGGFFTKLFGKETKEPVAEPSEISVQEIAQPQSTKQEESQAMIKEKTSPDAPVQNIPASGDTSIRIAQQKLDKLESSIGELVVLHLQQQESQLNFNTLRGQFNSMLINWKSMLNELQEGIKYLPVKQRRILENNFSNYTKINKRAYRDIYRLSKKFSGQVSQLGFVTNGIESDVRSVRMLPLAPYFESFARVVRDAARKSEREVRLEIKDHNIEVDRIVLEKLRDPLLHVLRNAVAHGIEPANQRAKLDKDPVGSIRLEAERDGDHVLIRVSDDGRGMDQEKIEKRAKKLGLLREEEELTNEKMVQVICQSGFSTSKSVDKVSGRGVGMDAVLAAVQSFHGTLNVETMEGFGTCIIIRAPVSITISQGVILQVGPYRFGITFDMVERIMLVRQNMVRTVENNRLIQINDDFVTLTELAGLLGCPQYAPKLTQHSALSVVIRSGLSRLALLVDDIPGEIPMVVKALGAQFEKIPLYSGGAIQSDGSVLPILDVHELIARQKGKRSITQSLEEDTERIISREDAEEEQLILVVDDSITTRTLERNILEASGYNVVTATNGEEALEVLNSMEGIGLLVTDMEMPKMDGIELCKQVRRSKFSDLPIIMVTSVGDEKEQRKGLEAGADAYIIKGNFRQENFLDIVRGLF